MDPDTLLASLNPQLEAIEAASASNTDIQKFYSKSSVFITGGTGFLGKQLIEKLLRATDVNKIYMLIRGKKEKSIHERLKNILEDPLFDKVRIRGGSWWSRVVCVEGDVAELRLGLSDRDWNTITQEVNMIFHLAATTKFDELLRLATFINVRGTREVVTLAKECIALTALVHVSTAFAHATSTRVSQAVLEQFYPCPVPPDAVIMMAEEVDDYRFYGGGCCLLKDWPNTYAFTKALAEEVVRTRAGGLPVCIMRPPYVMSTHYEPTPGWIDSSCVYGPSGMLIGIGLGIMHVSLNRNIKMPYCPADYVNNAILAAAWDVGKRQNDIDKDIEIYSLANTRNSVDWEFHRKLMKNKETIAHYSTPKAVWYSYLVETSHPFMYWILTWLLHYIPAYIADAFYYLFMKEKPKRVKSFTKLYQKLYNFGLTFEYFLTNEWYFDDYNLQMLFSRMTPSDQILFNFNIQSIDWNKLMYIWMYGLKKFVVKDDMEDKISGYRKHERLKIIHYLFFAVYGSVGFVSFYCFIKICSWFLL